MFVTSSGCAYMIFRGMWWEGWSCLWGILGRVFEFFTQLYNQFCDLIICLSLVYYFQLFYIFIVLFIIYLIMYCFMDYYYYYYYFTVFGVIHASISWWFFFTRVWVTTSLLKSLGDFSVFWIISIMLYVFLFLSSPGSVPNFWWFYRAYQLQLVSPPHSCSIVFEVL